MTQAPVPTGTTQGYIPPTVTQFAVFLDNRVGKMRELTCIFEGQALTLASLSVVDATSYAVVRLVTSNAALARRLLTRHGFAFSEVDILVVELNDDFSLTEICQCLTAVEVNIHYIYPLWVQPRGHPAMAVYTDDNTFAQQVYRRRLVTLLGENDLGDNATRSDPGTPDDAVAGKLPQSTPPTSKLPTDPADVDDVIDELFNELPELSDEDKLGSDDAPPDDRDDDNEADDPGRASA